MKKNYLFTLTIALSILSSTTIMAQTYTFTNAGAIGNVGPDQSMADAAYTGTTLDGNVEVINGIQYWVVPASGNYSIAAYGGQGYGDFGGRGAQMIGDFFLSMGDTLKILVGQQAGDYLSYPSTTYNHQFGGGGGSFVTQTNNTPYVVAGGGGGNHGVAFLPQCDGQITTDGASGLNGSTIGAGGIGGNGGQQASSADGGGGLLTDGTGGGAQGIAFVNGGLGGIDEGTGGFGGGGGTSSWNNYRGGGGGGYSGGGGGNNGGTCCPAGGGGGSFNAGTNQNNLAGVQLGHGLVVISNLCTSTSMVPDVAVLTAITEECSAMMPTPPTATSDCGTIIDGVPDVTFPISTPGTTTVTWTYDDGSTMTTQTQDVIIADITGPTPDSLSLQDSTYWCSVESLIIPTATDNCTGIVTVTNNINLPITTNGLTVVTWTYTDETGNTTTQDQNIYLNVIDNGITQTGGILSATMPGYTYQWLDCANNYAAISGENNQYFFPPSSSELFAVEVTENGCVDTSMCISLDFIGISNQSKDELTLYPNPSTDGKFKINSGSIITSVQLFDVAGRLIQAPMDFKNGVLDASALAPGKYQIQIITEHSNYSETIVILK